jgi:hypothetical protein
MPPIIVITGTQKKPNPRSIFLVLTFMVYRVETYLIMVGNSDFQLDLEFLEPELQFFFG